MQRFDKEHSLPTPHTLPDFQVLQTLMEMAQSRELDYSKFCEAAAGETAITTEIMRAARAIRAGRENGVEELRHAIAIIGMRRVHDILEKTRGLVMRERSMAE